MPSRDGIFGLSTRRFGDAGRFVELPWPVMFATLIINVLGLAMPLAILQVYDRIIPNQSLPTLTMMTIALFTVFVMEMVLKVVRYSVANFGSNLLAEATMSDGLARILNLDSAGQRANGVSQNNECLSAAQQVADFYGGQSRLLILDAPFMLIFLAMMLAVGGPLALVPVVVLATFAAFAYFRGKALRETFAQRNGAETRTYDFIIECLRSIDTIKSFAMEASFMRRFERLQKTVGPINYKMIAVSDGANTGAALLGTVSMLSIVTVGGAMAAMGSISVGTLACCSLISGRMMQPAGRALSAWNEVQGASSAMDEMSHLTALPPVETGVEPIVFEAPPDIHIDATFEADGSCETLRACVDIAAGSFCVIRNGTAETTLLLNALRGQVRPNSGKVLIGGRDAFAERVALRHAVCKVGQGSDCFRATILDNLTLFHTRSTVEEARDVCRMVGLEEEIHLLVNGYSTMLGEGAADRLPAGFLKRIAIARAIATNSPVILLDEPQAYLDRTSDEALISALKKVSERATLVVVSSRPLYWRAATIEFEIVGGELVEVGTAPDDGNKIADRIGLTG